MSGQREARRSGQGTMGRDVVGDEGPSPRKIAPWPWATTPWNWSEKRDQFEATRLPKHKVI